MSNSKLACEMGKPLFAQKGRKWIIAYHQNRPDLQIEDADEDSTVRLFKCENCALKVNEQVTEIIVDMCKGITLMIEDKRTKIEFINCEGTEMRVRSMRPDGASSTEDSPDAARAISDLDEENVSNEDEIMPSLD